MNSRLFFGSRICPPLPLPPPPTPKLTCLEVVAFQLCALQPGRGFFLSPDSQLDVLASWRGQHTPVQGQEQVALNWDGGTLTGSGLELGVL